MNDARSWNALPKVFVVVDSLVSYLDRQPRVLVVDVPSKQRVQHRLDGIHLVNQERLPKANCQLQRSREARVLLRNLRGLGFGVYVS